MHGNTSYARTKSPPTTLNAAETTTPTAAGTLNPSAPLFWLPEPPEPEPDVPVPVAPAVVEGAEGVKVAGMEARQAEMADDAAALLDGACAFTVALPAKSHDCALRPVAS